MTRPGRGWDPFRPLDVLAALWSTAAVAPVNTGAGAAYRTLFLTVRRLVVGRRLTVRLTDGELSLTITEFDSRLDLRALSVGQLNDVRLRRIGCAGTASDSSGASAVLHNVHMRASVPPVLVAAPVELTLELPAPALDELFRSAAPRLAGEVGPDGVARLQPGPAPRLGPRRGRDAHRRVDAVDPPARDRRGAAGGRCRSARPATRSGCPNCRAAFSSPASSLAPGVVRLTGTLPEWRMEVPRARLEDMINQLSAVGRPLNLIWPTRG